MCGFAYATLALLGAFALTPEANLKVVRLVEPEECWLSARSEQEQRHAEAGGMKLHKYVDKHPGDWVVCVLYGDLTLTPGDKLAMRFPGGECLSTEVATSSNAAEMDVKLLSEGYLTWRATDKPQTRSGGFLLMVRYETGTLPRDLHGGLEDPLGVRVERGNDGQAD